MKTDTNSKQHIIPGQYQQILQQKKSWIVEQTCIANMIRLPRRYQQILEQNKSWIVEQACIANMKRTFSYDA